MEFRRESRRLKLYAQRGPVENPWTREVHPADGVTVWVGPFGAHFRWPPWRTRLESEWLWRWDWLL